MLRGSVLRWSAVSLVATVLVGCGERASPVAPDLARASPSAVVAQKAVAKGQILKRDKALDADIVVSATITPNGGVLQIPTAGLTVYFPSGAVTRDLRVTAIANRGNRVVYTFEPHGAVFQQPVYLAQELRYTDQKAKGNNRPAIWGGYLANGLADVNADGTGSFAEVYGGVYSAKRGEIQGVFAIHHFSGYAYASGAQQSGGGGQQLRGQQ